MKPTLSALARAAALAAIIPLIAGSALWAQAPRPLFIGLGDSIGEGVQSADANLQTQPYSFINLISLLMGAPMPLPYIQSGPLATVESLSGRTRLMPGTLTLNLSVSGADTGSLLLDRANAVTTADINSETDLVLFPRLGSQIEIAEALHPQYVACWIGSNDALGAVLAYAQLDASQLTPLADFTAHFNEIARRLSAIGAKVVFGTIPDVTKIAFLLDASDLQRLTGITQGLLPGSYTSLVAAMGIRLGLLDPSVLGDPNLVLDPGEVALINQRIAEFNDVIRYTAAVYGMGVADTAAVFDLIGANPPVLFGVPLTTRFLGGLFSLDGVHPSNVGQLLVAKLFVETFNHQYRLAIPDVNAKIMSAFFTTDPFIDKDGDGRVTGRPGAGLIETVSTLIGWSGDTNDQLPSAPAVNVETAVDTLQSATGVDIRHGTRRQKLDALGRAFGIAHRTK